MQDVKVERYKYIGGSDIPIIMGLSKFKTRYDLLLEKAQLKDDDFEGNEYTEYGNVLEPKIRNYINSFYSMNFIEDKLIKDDVRCHFDGIDYNKKVILEIKTTSQIYEDIAEYKVYLVQLLFYMMNANINEGMLAVYNRPDDFDESFDDDKLQIFTINVDNFKELCVEIMEEVEQFRIDLKKLQDDPFTSEEDLINTNVVLLANKVIKLEQQLKLYDTIVKERDNVKQQLKEAMENYGIGGWQTPNGTKITLVEETPSKIVKKFNETKFKEENELLYNKYLEDKEQKGRAGYVRITFGDKDEK